MKSTEERCKTEATATLTTRTTQTQQQVSHKVISQVIGQVQGECQALVFLELISRSGPVQVYSVSESNHHGQDFRDANFELSSAFTEQTGMIRQALLEIKD